MRASQETFCLLRIALHLATTTPPHAVEAADSGEARHEYRLYLPQPQYDHLYQGRRGHGGIVVYSTTKGRRSYVSVHYLEDLRAEYTRLAEHVPLECREAVERLAAVRDQTTLPG
jgi:hypothetical protein